MGLIENIITSVSPATALERARARNAILRLDAERDVLEAKRQMLDKAMASEYGSEVTNSGYSHGAASRRRSWAKRYHSDSGSAKEDIEENRKLLRERSRDLAMNAPLASAAVNSTRTNCVGSGLAPKPKIDYEFLGIGQEEAVSLQRLIKKEFAVWAESTLCDNNDQNNFYELQQIAFNEWLRNGESFVLVKYDDKLPYMPYQLRLKLVEADRVCTKGSLDGEYDGYDRQEKNGNTVMNGVEVDKKGKVVAYHIVNTFPGEYGSVKREWKRVEKRGKVTGNPNILHVFNAERADQYRGVPFLAPVVQTIKQLTRYTESEIMAAVINAMFALFITTETGNDMGGFAGEGEEPEGTADASAENEDDEIKIGAGTVNFLKEGEGVHTVESAHPSGDYGTFISSMATQIGAALEIAPEVLLKKFGNNFSASKGALNETWKAFRMRRKWFVDDFCQEVYELWFNEAVSKGRISAPGYFNNILIKKAYTNATWNGPSQGHLNPLQEVNAAVARIDNGLSTHEDECASMNGSDYEENVRILKTENRLLAEAGKQPESGEERDGKN